MLSPQLIFSILVIYLFIIYGSIWKSDKPIIDVYYFFLYACTWFRSISFIYNLWVYTDTKIKTTVNRHFIFFIPQSIWLIYVKIVSHTPKENYTSKKTKSPLTVSLKKKLAPKVSKSKATLCGILYFLFKPWVKLL